jgi:hypothetical protein
MALEQAQLDWILRARKPNGVTKLLSLGYPDLLIERAILEAAGCRPVLTKDADKIAAWHNWKGPIYDTEIAFNSLAISLTAVDIRPSRNCETVLDLNVELHSEDWAIHSGRYDIILDPGTLEHCFNIGQAFLNVAAMVAPGGTIIHTNPLSCQNHGFVNLCPTAYQDFYGQNGFDVVYLGAMAGPVGNRTEAPLHPTRRDKLAPEVWSLVVVKAQSDWNGHAKWPTQSKYLLNPDLKSSPTTAG